jgi:hypothetical protein
MTPVWLRPKSHDFGYEVNELPFNVPGASCFSTDRLESARDLRAALP